MALLLAACSESPNDTCRRDRKDSSGVAGASEQADAAPPPSCSAAGPGLTDCGDNEESCCKSLPVQGGAFFRKYTNDNGCSPRDETAPSTVSSFRLDKYAVTVGRFRQFVDAWKVGWRPDAGSGKHTYVNRGRGLADSNRATGYELGWLSTNDDKVSLTTKDLTSCSGSNLTADYKRIPYACNTWTDEPDVNEHLPVVCVNWPEAYAFCIWDSGFLPSDAETEYAAAGGSEQRKYPWGPADPGQTSRYAIYECDYPTPSLCTSAAKIAPVGTAALGAARWGQLDLAGNVWQWSLGGGGSYVTQCEDCTDAGPAGGSIRGGGFSNDVAQLAPTYYWGLDGEERGYDTGLRCARAP